MEAIGTLSAYVKQWLHDLPLDLDSEDLSRGRVPSEPSRAQRWRKTYDPCLSHRAIVADGLPLFRSPQKLAEGTKNRRPRSSKHDSKLQPEPEGSRPKKRQRSSETARPEGSVTSSEIDSSKRLACHGPDPGTPQKSRNICSEESAVHVPDLADPDEAQDATEKYAKKPRRRTKTDKYEYKRHLETRVKKMPLTSEPVCRKQKRKKSGEKLSKSFKAPNVDSDRLTLRPSDSLGIFGRARSSAPITMRGLPDLTFSEMSFLKHGQNAGDPRHKQLHPTRRKREGRKSKETGVSEYFSRPFDQSAHGRASPDQAKVGRDKQSSLDIAAQRVAENTFPGDNHFSQKRNGPNSYVTWSTSPSRKHGASNGDKGNGEKDPQIPPVPGPSAEDYTKYALLGDLTHKHIEARALQQWPRHYTLEDLQDLAEHDDARKSQAALPTQREQAPVTFYDPGTPAPLSLPSSNLSAILDQLSQRRNSVSLPANGACVHGDNTKRSPERRHARGRLVRSLNGRVIDFESERPLSVTQKLKPQGNEPSPATYVHDAGLTQKEDRSMYTLGNSHDRSFLVDTTNEIYLRDSSSPNYAITPLAEGQNRIPSRSTNLQQEAHKMTVAELHLFGGEGDTMSCMDDHLDEFDIGLLEVNAQYQDPEMVNLRVRKHDARLPDQIRHEPEGLGSPSRGYGYTCWSGNADDLEHVQLAAKDEGYSQWTALNKPFQGFSRPNALY